MSDPFSSLTRMIETIDERENVRRLKALLAEALPYIEGKGGYMNHRKDIIERIQQEIKP